MKGNIFSFGLVFIGFLLSLVLFFNAEYILLYFGTSQSEIIKYNQTDNNFNFNFDNRYIIKCYNENYNECFLNLYIDEFKNNETIENIDYIQINKCYYKIDELSYQMSFIFNKNCLNLREQNIYINKTSTLTIDKIEIEYIGYNRNTFSLIDIISSILLLICVAFLLSMAITESS